MGNWFVLLQTIQHLYQYDELDGELAFFSADTGDPTFMTWWRTVLCCFRRSSMMNLMENCFTLFQVMQLLGPEEEPLLLFQAIQHLQQHGEPDGKLVFCSFSRSDIFHNMLDLTKNCALLFQAIQHL